MNTSIIIPRAEDRGYYEEALKSAQVQTAGCEIITISQTQSLSKNFNAGLKIARGKFIKILPDDDILEPGCLEILEEAIKDNDFVFANAINFKSDGQSNIQKPLNPPVTFAKMIQKNQIHGGTVLYRTDVLRAVGGFNETLWTGEEYELHLRLMSLGYKWGYVDKVVFRYRLHGQQKSLGAPPAIRKKRKEEIARIQKQYS